MNEDLLRDEITRLRGLLAMWLAEQDQIGDTGEVDGDDHDQLVQDTNDALRDFF
jgi:hypothetical protein